MPPSSSFFGASRVTSTSAAALPRTTGCPVATTTSCSSFTGSPDGGFARICAATKLISSPNKVSASLSSTSSSDLALASSLAIRSISASAFLFCFGGNLSAGIPVSFAGAGDFSGGAALISPGSSIRLLSIRRLIAWSSVISGITSGISGSGSGSGSESSTSGSGASA